MITKEIRSELKRLGYTLKLKRIGGFYVANIYKNDEWVYGGDANVYPKEVMNTHKEAIKLVWKLTDYNGLKVMI